MLARSLLAFYVLFATCSVVLGSLEGCSLLAGGEFTYANANGNVQSGFLEYDVSSGSFMSTASVYKDGEINSLIELDNQLFFAGDFVRVQDQQSIAIGVYNTENESLLGVAKGLWIQGNSLPTSDSHLSPTLLFVPYSSGILIAGHFDYQNGAEANTLNNLALYSTTSNSYNTFNQDGMYPSGPGSIISLSKEDRTGKLCAATMTTDSHYRTHVSCYNRNTWDTLSMPSSSSTRILFNSLVLTNNSTLFALAYTSSSASLTESSIQYSLLSWDLNHMEEGVTSVFVYQKECSGADNNLLVFPTMAKYDENSVLIASPQYGCAEESPVRFQVFNRTATISAFPVLPSATLTSSLQVVDEDLFYFSNGSRVYRYESGSYTKILGSDDMRIPALFYSSESELLYASYNYGYEPSVISFENGKTYTNELFVGSVYCSGTVMTIADMNDDQIMIGGDFKYVESNGYIKGAKLAALWDGSEWKATLASNNNNYLPGWTLLSAASIGNAVFAFADAGRDTDLLPLLRWTESEGWLFLYKRPEILDYSAWDNTVGTVYIDEPRSEIYFGGEFVVGLSSGEIATGGCRYSFHGEIWAPVPGDLQRINTFGMQSGVQSPFLQIGGLFSFSDDSGVIHENYALLDQESNVLLPGSPSLRDSEVFAFSLFPGHSEYSFIGGRLNDDGVKRILYTDGDWSVSSVGSPALKETAFSLATRNGSNILFAGGSFTDGLSQLDISQQRWTSLLPYNPAWLGDVKSLVLLCPTDTDNYSYITVDESSRMSSFYSVESCSIPLGAPDDYVCPNDMSLSKATGLLFVIFLTFNIVLFIALLSYRKWKKDASEQMESVEYL